MKFNINHDVRVKLTDRGMSLHKESHDKFWAQFEREAPKYTPPKEDADGWSTWQLWTLMHDFGPYISMSLDTPFETEIELVISEPPARKELTIDEIIVAWNEKADQYNQWESLDADERVNFVLSVVNANALPARRPLSDDEREEVLRKATKSHNDWTEIRKNSASGQGFVQKDYFHTWLIIETETAHGITDTEQSNAI
jgi:hypothetical protein